MLTEALRELGWTKKRFADWIGVHPNMVSRWGESPPLYAQRALEERLKLKRARDRLTRDLDD
jgi:predicted transcriptional regulator